MVAFASGQGTAQRGLVHRENLPQAPTKPLHRINIRGFVMGKKRRTVLAAAVFVSLAGLTSGTAISYLILRYGFAYLIR